MKLDNFDIDEFIGAIIDSFEDYLERKGVVADMIYSWVELGMGR